MTPKQDRVGARTVQDLERRINPTKIRDDIEAKTKLVIQSGLKEAGEDVLSYINVSSNVLSIKSDNFNLTKEGVVEAKAGIIGGCKIVDEKLLIGNANIAEKLTADNIDATNLTIENESTKGDYSVKISEGNIYFKAPQHIYNVVDAQTGLNEKYTETPIMRVHILGSDYWVCIKSKLEPQEVEGLGLVYKVVPVGLVITQKLHDGSQEV